MSNKINTENWGKFSYDEFFKLITTNKKLSNKDLSDNGNTPVYSSSTTNNGLFGYTEKKPEYLISESIPMYLIFGDHTKSMFIVKNNFSVMDNVKVLIPKIENEYCIRFITTVWKKSIPNIGYARHWATAKSTLISLPIKNNGEPDWDYIEKYMKQIEFKTKRDLGILKNHSSELNKCNTSRWKSFKIGDIFEVKRPAARSQSNYDEGEVPFVASGNYNNGIIKYLKPKQNELLDKGNCISVSPVDGSAFYQKCDFLGRGGAGSSIILLYNDSLNENIGCFLATVIRKVCSKYMYGDMGNKESIKNETIMLPATDDDNPDYEFMNQFIKKMKVNLATKLNNLSKI